MILVVPDTSPVTTPVVAFTDPMAGELELHVPPGVTSVRSVVRPTHTVGVPLIVAGIG